MTNGDDIRIYRKSIIEICRNMNLPLTVRGTSIGVFDKIVDRMRRSDVNIKDVINLTIVLALKCEEIHGNIDTIIRSLPDADMDNFFRHEDEIFQLLDFDFHFPSLYLRMYGIIAILQEKGLIKVMGGQIDINGVSAGEAASEVFVYEDGVCTIPSLEALWRASVAVLDEVLVCDKREFDDIELIYASLQLPLEIYGSLNFPFRLEKVKLLRKMSLDVKSL
jgi:hypothetical protein